jgi:polyphosphate:AMP phosphotransferase
VFEIAEVGRSLPADAYESEERELRTALLKAQTALGNADFPVIVLLHGTDQVAAASVLNVLHAWFDARYLVTHAIERQTDEERERPEYWRYWQWLPPRRRIGVFLGSWYTKPMRARVRGKLGRKGFHAAVERAKSFEDLLVKDGALIIKVWLHTKKEKQLKRLARDVHARKNYQSRHEYRKLAYYDEYAEVGAELITDSSTGPAPWTIVESADFRYRNVTVGRLLVSEMERHLARERPTATHPESLQKTEPIPILDTLDLTKRLEHAEYETRLRRAQVDLVELALEMRRKARSAVIVFEGSDAAGKGGAIRRLTSVLDARQYAVTPISAPSEEERAFHYLWRFWRRIPRHEHFTIYDRSWYGRVLVERVEGFATEAEYRAAYGEINDFEKQLLEAGNVVVKFWLQISKTEQDRRFQSRKSEPWKQYKLTDEDYRNRAKSAEYEIAANEMLTRTDTTYAPWDLVEAEDKGFARVKVVETVCKRLRDALSG